MGSLETASSRNDPLSSPQIIQFGDSITQGSTMTLQPWLQTRYSRRADIINRGFSGYTAVQGLGILPRFVHAVGRGSAQDVRAIIVWFGTNDASLSEENPGVPRVPLELYRQALSKIITSPLLTERAAQVILVTPPPVDEHQIPHARQNAERTAQYAAAVRDLAREYHLPLIDCWTLFMTQAGWKDEASPLPGSERVEKSEALASLLSDGIHLTQQAYSLLYPEILDVIRRDVPALSWENMPLMIAQDIRGYEWETLCAVEQVQQQGYPITEKDREHILQRKSSWDKIWQSRIESPSQNNTL